jgi:hypothetical protein
VRKRGEYTLGHWANIEPRLCEIIAKNNGILPGSKWLIKNGYADLNTAIIRHHGGFATVRDKLRTFGILKDQPSSNEIFQQLKDAMDGSDGPLP